MIPILLIQIIFVGIYFVSFLKDYLNCLHKMAYTELYDQKKLFQNFGFANACFFQLRASCVGNSSSE